MFVLVHLLHDAKIDRIRGTLEILPVRQRIYFLERPDQTRGEPSSSGLSSLAMLI